MENITEYDILGMKAIKTIRSVSEVATTDKEAAEIWDDLLIFEKESLIEAYEKLQKLIN